MLIRILLGAAAVLAGLAALLWFSLTPPAPLARPEPGIVLENVTLLQPGEGRRARQRLVVEGGTIAEVGPAGAAAMPSGTEGAQEWSGAFVLPGLIDMHVHFPPETGLRQTELFAFLHLAHGVTTVRDAGDVDGTATAPARDGVREGDFPGPRVLACGPLVDGPDPVWANTRVIATPGDAEPAVAQIKADGFDCVKAYTNLTPDTLAAVRAAAKKHDLPVIGHVPARVPFEEARLDDVQHLTGAHPPRDPPLPFPKVLVGWRDFTEERARFITGMSLAYDIAHTPTLVVLDRQFAMRDYEAARQGEDVGLLPRIYRDVVWSPTEGLPFVRNRSEEDYRLFEDALLGSQELVARMHRAGVRIHAGTDCQIPFVVPGAALHRELHLLSEAGLGPEGALAAATTVPGASLGIAGLGRLDVGSPADLLLFAKDPTRNLDHLDTLLGVVADGRVYRRADLDAQQEAYRRHHDGRIFDATSVFLTRQVLKRIFATDEDAAAQEAP